MRKFTPFSGIQIVNVVVYFDQRLGAAHPKCWSKQSFSAFFVFLLLEANSFDKKEYLREDADNCDRRHKHSQTVKDIGMFDEMNINICSYLSLEFLHFWRRNYQFVNQKKQFAHAWSLIQITTAFSILKRTLNIKFQLIFFRLRARPTTWVRP